MTFAYNVGVFWVTLAFGILQRKDESMVESLLERDPRKDGKCGYQLSPQISEHKNSYQKAWTLKALYS